MSVIDMFTAVFFNGYMPPAYCSFWMNLLFKMLFSIISLKNLLGKLYCKHT